jgi:hypothetical protein
MKPDLNEWKMNHVGFRNLILTIILLIAVAIMVISVAKQYHNLKHDINSNTQFDSSCLCIR